MALPPAGLMLCLGLWGVRRHGGIWRDEVVTHDMAHRDFADLWATLQHVDVVHGLYYALMHLWFALYDQLGNLLANLLAPLAAALGHHSLASGLTNATLGRAVNGFLGGPPGDGMLALRLPSVLAMTAAAAGVALLGERLVGRRAGLFAGAAFALTPLVQQYAQEGRSYAMVCALVVWATLLLVRAAAAPRRARWTGYTALMLGACLLHEFACLVLPVHGTALVLARLPRRTLRAWCTAAGCVAAGLAPLALFSAGQSEQLSWLVWPDPVQLLTFALLAAAGIACARVPVRSRGPIGLRALGVPLLLLPTLLLFLLSHAEPAYVDRYVLSYVAGFALLAGAALARILRPVGEDGQTRKRRLRRTGALALVLAALLPVGIHLRSPASRVDDATAVADAVRELGTPGDGLLFAPARRRVWAAVHPDAYHGLHDLALDRSPVASRTLYGTERTGDDIRDRMLLHDRIVVAGDPESARPEANDLEIAKRATLHASFSLCDSRDVRGARVAVWAKPGHCPS